MHHYVDGAQVVHCIMGWLVVEYTIQSKLLEGAIFVDKYA